MPSKAEFRQEVDQVINDNTSMGFVVIHGLLHEGLFASAEELAKDIGLNTPPGELPLLGWGLTQAMKTLLQETLDSHWPSDSGLPDHEF
jgi:hypothetical protein